jgi:large subunit ribosomal protein L32
MAVPRNRVSNSKKNLRRSHHAKKPKSIQACTQCGKATLPHRICSHCGSYKGRQILKVKDS